jgi:peptidylprolyl isomerase
MRPGETKTVRLPAELAFGPRHPERKFRVARSASMSGPLRPGDAVRISSGSGSDLLAIVEEVDGDSVLVDANHPLSGRDLTFEINVLDVVPREAMIAC